MPALAEPSAQLTQDIIRWRDDPIAFFVEALAVRADLIWQPMEDMARSVIENKHTAVAGCHNSSKTFTAACLAWWWVICKQPAIVYVTAPKEDQLKDVFWSQLRQLYDQARIPIGGDLQSLDWRFYPDTYIAGRTSRKDTGAGGATGMQGYKSPRLLMIWDEATAIDRAFWESAMGVVTFPENRWVTMANPTNPNCGFRDCWRPDSGWHTINIDALENPNLLAGEIVHPYLASPEWVEDMRKIYGEGSPAWESRVRGRFPDTSIDTLISIADFRMACDREPTQALDQKVFVGADLARQGDDYSVVAVIKGNALIDLQWFHVPDLTKVIDQVILIAESHGIGQPMAQQISVDASGFGWGAYDYARRIGWNVRGEDFGSSAHKDEQWADRRTEMWVGVRDWLQNHGSLSNARPDWIRFLEADLCGCCVDPGVVKGGITVSRLEPKKEMKKRLGHSPDHGDALALALAPMTKPGRLYQPRDLIGALGPTESLASASRAIQAESYAEDRENLKARKRGKRMYE